MNDDHATVRLTLRLPAELRNALQQAADGNTRSMNGQIVAILEQAMRERPDNLREAPSGYGKANLEQKIDSLTLGQQTRVRALLDCLIDNGML